MTDEQILAYMDARKNNYCLDYWNDLTYDTRFHEIKFKNYAHLSLHLDGFSMALKFIDKIYIEDGTHIKVALKGSDYKKKGKVDVLWDGETTSED